MSRKMDTTTTWAQAKKPGWLCGKFLYNGANKHSDHDSESFFHLRVLAPS